MQTVIHQTLRTFLHERINIEEARTIITLYRYNEMRECEDIQLIQIWIALEDFTSCITSLQQKQPASVLHHMSTLYRYHTEQCSQPHYYLSVGQHYVLRSRWARHRAMLQQAARACYVLHYPYILYTCRPRPNIRIGTFHYIFRETVQLQLIQYLLATTYVDSYHSCPLQATVRWTINSDHTQV